MYRTMLSVDQYDEVMEEADETGRISFFIANHGEEALQAGSVAALDCSDVVYAQYREVGWSLSPCFYLVSAMEF